MIAYVTILCVMHLKKINACHNHNVRMKTCNLKIKFSRTTKKSECISVKGPKMWNTMSADTKLCKLMYTIIFFTKLYFYTLSIWLMLLFVLLYIYYVDNM